jgi:hypothetical protein
MRKALTVLALLALFPAFWQPLRGQSPRKGIDPAIVKEPKGRKGGNDNSGTEQSGSKERPLVVDTKGHQDTPAETAEANSEKEHVRYIEGRTLYFAKITAWANVALIVIGFGGVVAAIWTLRQIKRQADLTQATLMLTFPPKLVVRNVILFRENVPRGTPLSIGFAIANIGGSTAHIVESFFDSHVFEDGPPPLPIYTSAGGVPNAWNGTLMPGEEQCFVVNIEDEDLIGLFGMYGTHDNVGTVHQRSRYLYFVGRAKFQTDKMTSQQEGVIRSIGVCRHYDLRKGRFVTVDDSDYEYGQNPN